MITCSVSLNTQFKNSLLGGQGQEENNELKSIRMNTVDNDILFDFKTSAVLKCYLVLMTSLFDEPE